MNKVNRKLVYKIVLIIAMIAVLTFFTGCSFSSDNIALGIAQLGDGIRMAFDGLVNGVVTVVRGIFEGIWTLIEGFFNVIIGGVAWVVETITDLFQ